MKLTSITLKQITGSVFQPRSQTDLEIGELADSIGGNKLSTRTTRCTRPER